MSIYVDENTRVVVQGITGRDGSFHTRQMMAYGTRVVSGVTPGKGGRDFEGPRGRTVPVFDTVAEAVGETGADASVIYVPPAFAASAIMEAADAGVGFIVCVTEGIPVLDMTRAHALARDRGCRILGPNCPGIICPGKTTLGIIPGRMVTPGPVGLISRSGTLTYEAVHHLTRDGLGQTTCVGIGGDPLIGTSFVDCLAAFAEDSDTEAMVMIGEIGGTAEQEAAAWASANLDHSGGRLHRRAERLPRGSAWATRAPSSAGRPEPPPKRPEGLRGQRNQGREAPRGDLRPGRRSRWADPGSGRPNIAAPCPG